MKRPVHATVLDYLRRGPAALATRLGELLLARALLRRARLGSRVGASGLLRAELLGTCRVGDRVNFRGGMVRTHLRVHPGGSLVIGDDSVFNYGVSIEVFQNVEIGARCMLASMVRIADRNHARQQPVRIGDDVWIAHGAILEPGVTIGRGAVIAAGSVVSSDVPENHLACGNPARVAPLSLLSREPGPVPGRRIAR